jgi:co-chaperonin GroES (HSP10)
VRWRREADALPKEVRPIRRRVLVVIDEREAMSKGGIHIAPIAQGLPNTATVVRIGPKVTTCEPGDHVVIEKYAHGDREYLMLGEPARRHLLVEEDQILAVLGA